MRYCSALRRIVLRAGADAGLVEPLTAHMLRRSCTSDLVRGNANLHHVSRMLGHETLDTLRHYVRLNIADIQKTHRLPHPWERDESRRNEDAPEPSMGADRRLRGRSGWPTLIPERMDLRTSLRSLQVGTFETMDITGKTIGDRWRLTSFAVALDRGDEPRPSCRFGGARAGFRRRPSPFGSP